MDGDEKKEKPKRASAVMAMPAEAIHCEPLRSAHIPARLDKRAIIIGWVNKIIPAWAGDKARLSCRYKDNKKEMA